MPNVSEMLLTLAEIEADLDAWGQGRWDTCFAGITLRRHGWSVEPNSRITNGREQGFDPASAAEEILGMGGTVLTHSLFSGYAEIEYIRYFVGECADGREPLPLSVWRERHNSEAA